MKPFYQSDNITIYNADVLDALREMPSESVHACITSPPYFALRSYLPDGHPDKAKEIGLESSPQAWIEKMVEVFGEVKRVLRRDGLCFVNVGDSYSSGGGSHAGRDDNQPGVGAKRVYDADAGDTRRRPSRAVKPGELEADAKRAEEKGYETQAFAGYAGWNRCAMSGDLPAKNLMMMPARLAIAMQDAGWVLRSDIIWAKPNPMPESVTDRPTGSHEHLFMFAKSGRYYYDQESTREAQTSGGSHPRIDRKYTTAGGADTLITHGRKPGWGPERNLPNGRNLRDVWTISTEPFAAAHFATYPRALVRPCVRAGTSEKGVCSACGAQYVRVVESVPSGERLANGEFKTSKAGNRKSVPGSEITSATSCFTTGVWNDTQTLGWRASCTCNAEIVPAVCLDPFFGSGTTALVCLEEGRRCIGIDLSRDYCELAVKRLFDKAPLFAAAGEVQR